MKFTSGTINWTQFGIGQLGLDNLKIDDSVWCMTIQYEVMLIELNQRPWFTADETVKKENVN